MNRTSSLFKTIVVAALTVLTACSDKKTTPSTAAKSRQALGTDVSLTASTLSPAVSGVVNLTLTAPVHADQSLISQSLQVTFDKTKMTATAAPTVPDGWTTTYFNGTTALAAAPSSPAAWANVDKIVASGSVESDGSAVGQQVIIGHADGTVVAPPTATSFSGGSAGDGWDVFFNEARTKVFNIHHHDGPATVMCRNASDGSTCGAGYPFQLYHTADRSTGWVDPTNNHLWHPTNNNSTSGWECVDVSGTPAYCTPRFVSAGTAINQGYNSHMDIAVVGRELYSVSMSNGALTCLDLDTATPCAGQPYAGFGGTSHSSSNVKAIGDKIYSLVNGSVKCFDPATHAACAGMTWPQYAGDNPLMPVPDADGVVRNVCATTSGSVTSCFDLSGGATTLSANFRSYVGVNRPSSLSIYGYYPQYNGLGFGGSRVFWPGPSGRAFCFDSATDAACPNWPIAIPVQYSIVVDPMNVNCIWTNGDDGTIRTWDLPTGTAGCKAPPPPPPVATYYPQAVIPRLACDAATRVGAWKSFTVQNPEPSEYTSATVTIKDSAGVDIAGWVNVALPANQVLDLSGLSTAATGLNPSFAITFVGMASVISGGTVTGGPKADFKVLGDSPQLCLSTQMRACQTGFGLFPVGGASSTPVNGSGSAALSGGSPVAFTGTSVSINDAAALVSNCGATLQGTLATAAPIVPMAGLEVGLLDSLGQTVPGAAGAPLTASTAADGTYSFPALLPQTYGVRMAGASGFDLKSISVVPGVTVNASAIGGNSGPVVMSGGATSTVNGLYEAPSVASDGGVAAFNGSSQFTFTASTLAPAQGSTVDYSAKVPLQNVRTVVANELSARIDLSRQHLTSAPTIPEGWTATYYSDGGVISPASAAGWSSVDRIVTTGSVRYDGVVNGYQMFIGATTATAPPPTAANFSGGSAGDGWDVFFSPDRKRVFNVHHHDGPQTIMCRNAADGSSCGAGYPFTLFHTSNRSTGWIDADTGYFWHETFSSVTGQAGWECVDVSGSLGTSYSPPSFCPTRFVSAGFSASNSFDAHIDLVAVGKELYSLDSRSGRLTCLDVATGAPCAGQPYAGFGGTNSGTISITTIEGLVYVHGTGKVKCFDPSTKASCTNGWPVAGTSTAKARPVMAVPDANGSLNVCVQGDCWSATGAASTLPAAFSTFMAGNPVTSGCCGDYYSSTSFGGTKLYFPMSSSRLQCWDSATAAKCATTNTAFPLTVPSIYTARVDPADENCVWTNGDDGTIRTFNVQTGQNGCAPPPGLAKFKPAITLPRLACDPAKRVGDWSIFKLTAPATTEYSTATLTVRDTAKAIIPGWSNLPIPANQKVDLSGLTTAMTGTAPTFEVTFADLTSTGNPTADFTIVSGSPELCFTTVDTCPSGPGLLPTAAPASTIAEGAGSLTLIDASVIPFAPIQRSVQFAAPGVAACGGTIAGSLASVEGRVVQNVAVKLFDANDNLTDTQSSNGQSAFAFPAVIAGNYRVKLEDVRGWVLNSVTVASGTTLASNGAATSNTISVTRGSANAASGLFHIGDSDDDGLTDDLESGPNFADLDTDGDGVADHLDLDSDDDGVLDAIENHGLAVLVDTDSDGTPDLRDSDSDADGIADVIEAGFSDDLAVTRLSGPVGNNGIADGIESAPESGIVTGAIRNTDGDSLPDYLDLDSDADGLTDALETATDTDADGIGNWRDLDADNDGIPDTLEGSADTDSDGTRDSLDLDSDGDSIPDAVEAGFQLSQLDANGAVQGPFGSNGLADVLETSAGSGVINYAVRDQNNDGTADYRSIDADGDGLLDATEKGLSGLPIDSDGDHLADYLDLDSDEDSISDAVESNFTGVLVDTDEDFTPDYLDLDADGDTIPDEIETNADTDSDTVGNWRDLDADEDHIADAVETAVDTDQDGTRDFLDTDSDDDGLSDALETNGTGVLANTDGDLKPDYLDLDSDADSIPDAVESATDVDTDGFGNWRDLDSDDDGITDQVEAGADGEQPRNTDADAFADYVDVDSDGDQLPDSWERGTSLTAQRDSDADGTPDYRDLDSDGDLISDEIETDLTGTPADSDTDGTPDVLDLDSDEDGIADFRESSNDFDSDGTGNWRDLDADGDGLTDTWEKGPTSVPRDSDLDGHPDFIDLDSDADTIPDSVERGIISGVFADTDGDGTLNLLDLDSDNDCTPDLAEPFFSTDASMPRGNPSDNCGVGGACNVATGACIVPCGTDADCGGLTSGDICEPTTRTCVSGCRGINGNGCPASQFCTSETVAAGICELDSDGDTLVDRLELQLGLDPMQPDSDGDGIGDEVESNGGVVVDTDHDGVVDALDGDSDADGIRDLTEGVAHYRDLDSDGDGYPDSVELAVDTDGDGLADYLDMDSDGDGVSDAQELAFGTVRTHVDSDADGIPDGVELGVDTDGDGVIDALDTDSDADGLVDALEAGADGKRPVDSDHDGKADYQDTDADGDGIPDAVERGSVATGTDTDGDGVTDCLDTDSDGDGVNDAAEAGQNPAQPIDTDGDGLADFRDVDSDNDCISDEVEEASARLVAGAPSGDADLNCPAAAPMCDTSVGRCVLPENALPVTRARLQGAGGNAGCSSVSGFTGLLGLLALGLRRRRSAR